MGFAGTPTRVSPAGASRTTTAPAPIIAPAPIRTPGIATELVLSVASASTTTLPDRLTPGFTVT